MVVIHDLLIQHHVGGYLVKPLGALLGELGPAHILSKGALLVHLGSHMNAHLGGLLHLVPRVRPLLLRVGALGLALLRQAIGDVMGPSVAAPPLVVLLLGRAILVRHPDRLHSESDQSSQDVFSLEPLGSLCCQTKTYSLEFNRAVWCLDLHCLPALAIRGLESGTQNLRPYICMK